MKVFIQNQSGSGKREALLDKDSGVIEYLCGKITCVSYELQRGAMIEVYKPEKHDALCGKKKAPDTEPCEHQTEEPKRRGRKSKEA